MPEMVATKFRKFRVRPNSAFCPKRPRRTATLPSDLLPRSAACHYPTSATETLRLRVVLCWRSLENDWSLVLGIIPQMYGPQNTNNDLYPTPRCISDSLLSPHLPHKIPVANHLHPRTLLPSINSKTQSILLQSASRLIKLQPTYQLYTITSIFVENTANTILFQDSQFRALKCLILHHRNRQLPAT